MPEERGSEAGSSWRVAWWLSAALLLVLPYLPTLAHPLDFSDDGALAYTASQVTLYDLPSLIWNDTLAGFHKRGPFRPVFWAHSDGIVHLVGPHAFPRRVLRLSWALLAVVPFLCLLRALRVAPGPALLTAAIAFWNPYRAEIWLGTDPPYPQGLCLGEGTQFCRHLGARGMSHVIVVPVAETASLPVTDFALAVSATDEPPVSGRWVLICACRAPYWLGRREHHCFLWKPQDSY